jgi:hypothetical protein
MRARTLVGFFFFCIASISPQQSALATIYDVDISAAAGATITGYIETDGTLGPILVGGPFQNITDWNLVISQGTATFDVLGPMSGDNSWVVAHGASTGIGFWPLIATPTTLQFDYSTIGSSFGFRSKLAPVGLYLSWYGSPLDLGSTEFDVIVNGPSLQIKSITYGESGLFTIGVADPAPGPVVGAGLPGLIAACAPCSAGGNGSGRLKQQPDGLCLLRLSTKT